MDDSFDTQIDLLPVNTSHAIEIAGECILVCNFNGTHFAVENKCTHQDTPLTEGRIRNGHITCPLHGVRFELATGIPKGELTRVPLRTYPVIESEGKVLIRVKQDG